RLCQKERRLEIGADQVVPVVFVDVSNRGRIEGGGVVDQDVEAAEGCRGGVGQLCQGGAVEQIALRQRRGARPDAVELLRHGGRFLRRAAVVQHHAGAGRVQRTHDAV